MEIQTYSCSSVVKSRQQSNEWSTYGGCALPKALQSLLYLLPVNIRKGTLAFCEYQERNMALFEQLFISKAN